jgi:hypothetical protein
MDASTAEQVSGLLAEGLDHYGCDEIGDAIEKWREVLRLDPGNAEAIDYLQTADRRDQRRLPMEDQMSDKVRHIVHAAHQTIVADDWEGALDILGSAGEGEPAGLEFEATLEIVRSRLLRRYTQRVGDLNRAPMLSGSSADLTNYNLPPDAGFMLSLIDGTTPLSDLISLSGMDAFDALRIVRNLLDAKIVEMRS